MKILRMLCCCVVSLLLLITACPLASNADYVEVNGANLYYEVHGEGNTGIPVIMLHGGFSNINAFDSQIADLSQL